MRLTLKIAEQNILISDFPFHNIPKQLKPFVTNFSERDTDIVYQVNLYKKPLTYTGECISNQKYRSIYKKDNIYTLIFRYFEQNQIIEYGTIFNFFTNRFEIYLPEDYNKHYFTHRLFMSFMALDFALLKHNIIVMHASVIKYNNTAILFTGPSGIGKSTQADLWKKYKNAGIINGDRAFLHTGKANINVYGSPYAGSSSIYKNDSAKVKAIVLLEQSDTNTLEEISIKERYKNMYPRFSIADFDMELLNLCMDQIEMILHNVRVYKLCCRPDREAVSLLYRTIYEKGADYEEK